MHHHMRRKCVVSIVVAGLRFTARLSSPHSNVPLLCLFAAAAVHVHPPLVHSNTPPLFPSGLCFTVTLLTRAHSADRIDGSSPSAG